MTFPTVTLPPPDTHPLGELHVLENIRDRRLETRARDIMTPGVIAISDEASVEQAHSALVNHNRHAILVVGSHAGTPLGWVTARGMLDWLQRDMSLPRARDAITEQPVSVHPFDSTLDVIAAMTGRGVSHVLVAHDPHGSPEGVIGLLDLMRHFGR